MLEGGGKMVIAAGNRQTGPGHFGLFKVADGVEKMSCHFEADFDRGGRSVLGIRPLLWKNGWPLPVKYSKRERMRLNPSVEVMPLNLPSILYVWNIPDTASGKKTTRRRTLETANIGRRDRNLATRKNQRKNQ